MKINTAGPQYTTQRAQTGSPATTGNENPASFSSALDGSRIEPSSTKSSGTERINFNNMTRQGMRDWLNGQIRSGKMSLDESSPLMAMTLEVSVATGQPVDSATDTARIDFMEKARLGIEGAMSRNELEAAKRLQVAMEIMLRNQGQAKGVDTHA